MQEALVAAGFRLVDWEQPADVRVVNTCTVTAKSDRTCRHEIHSAKRLDQNCLLVVTGCLAQVSPESVAELPGVDLVLGNPDKRGLAAHLAAFVAGADPAGAPRVAVSAYPEQREFEADTLAHFHGRTRAFLKVQNGCDNQCTYCIVPLARGPARSMPKTAVLEQVRLLAAQGYREIVLTGIDLGSWGKDLSGEADLAGLLTTLLSDDPFPAPGAARGGADPTLPLPLRLRLSSVEPLEVTDALLEVVQQAGDRVARHFHLPLQSGCDSVLARMGRPYRAARYLEATGAIARRLPDAAIGADVIVGFPGETDAQFEETLTLVEHSPLTYLHVFAYSDRPGTAAATMLPKISPEVIKQRSERLRLLGADKRDAFRGRLVGSEQTALVLEERAGDGWLVGLTGNYMEVLVPEDEGPKNEFVRVTLQRPLADGRWIVTLRAPEA